MCYYGLVGSGSSVEAEIWAVHKGLNLAKQRGYERIITVTNALSTVDPIVKEQEKDHPWFQIILECQKGRLRSVADKILV